MCGRPPWRKGFLDVANGFAVRSCVRPVYAAPMAAGPDEVRVPVPYQVAGLRLSWQYHGVFWLRRALIIITSIALASQCAA